MGIIMIYSLILSVLYILLFWVKKLALNFTIFSLLFTLFFVLILKKSGKVKNKKAYFLLIPIVILNLTYSIFNNNNLNSLNLIIIPILNLIMAFILLGDKLEYKTIIKQCFYSLFETLANISISLGKAKDYIKIRINLESKKENKSKSGLIKGIFITLLLVFVIIILLSSADSNFGNIFITIAIKFVNLLPKANLWRLIGKLIVGFIVFALFISFFDYVTKKLEANQFEESNENSSKDSTTIKMVLIALNLVYLLFVCVQINTIYRFTRENADFSNYARQGFFQLMIVSLINIVTILIAKNRWKENSSNLYIKVNSVIMIAFTVVLIVLSGLRMYEYVNFFGLTFLRIAVYFALLAELLVIIPTLIYVLKSNVNLNKIYFTVFLSLYIVFNCINVNNIIASYNVDKLENAGKIDTNYLQELGEDTSKQLIRALDSRFLDAEEKHDIAVGLSNFQKEYEDNFDIREANLSKVISYNVIKNSNYKDYILTNNNFDNQSFKVDSGTGSNGIEEYDMDQTSNPYTSDSPVVEDNIEISETYDFLLGNNFTKEDCNLIALEFIQDIANTSKADWAKNWYSRYTVVYESKPVVGVRPNNYWELIRDNISAPDVNMKVESWTESCYEVTLVRYDDELKMDRVLIYVNPSTGKVTAGYEMGD